MALLKYFNRVNSLSETVLPNPESSLNQVIDWKVKCHHLPALEQTDVCKHADFLQCF